LSLLYGLEVSFERRPASEEETPRDAKPRPPMTDEQRAATIVRFIEIARQRQLAGAAPQEPRIPSVKETLIAGQRAE
jgi:hypothetical protein